MCQLAVYVTNLLQLNRTPFPGPKSLLAKWHFRRILGKNISNVHTCFSNYLVFLCATFYNPPNKLLASHQNLAVYINAILELN
jgi:hypothetical protein